MAVLDGFYCTVNLWIKLCKCSKILKTFLGLFSNEMLVNRTGIHRMLVKIANREDLDQTASSGSVLFV